MVRVARWWERAFGTPVPLIGVVHLAALPGTSGNRRSIDEVTAQAVADAKAYATRGVDGLIVENFGDTPFEPREVSPDVVASMTRIAGAVREVTGDRPLGINVLRNDARAALAVAAAVGAAFIRVNVLAGACVTDQGIIEGDAAGLLRAKRSLGAEIRIFADVRVKHASPLRDVPIEIEAEELVKRAGADALLVTGESTGRPPDVEELARVRSAASGAPVLVASGAAPENLADLAAHANGFIVGTSLKVGGRTEASPDPARIRRFVAALRRTGRDR